MLNKTRVSLDLSPTEYEDLLYLVNATQAHSRSSVLRDLIRFMASAQRSIRQPKLHLIKAPETSTTDPKP